MSIMLSCKVCGNYFGIHKFKHFDSAYNVCSIECFKKGLIIMPEAKIKAIASPIGVFDSFRSKVEEQFSNLLDLENIKQKHERYFFKVFIHNHYTYYLPDFYLPEYKVYVEIKDGLWESGAYSKFKAFSKLIPLILIDRNMILQWRKKNGK